MRLLTALLLCLCAPMLMAPTGGVPTPLPQIAQTYQQTPAELAAGVTPSNLGYREGWVTRYGMLDDNSTDNSSKLATLVTIAQAGITLYWPKVNTGTYLSSTPLTFTSPVFPVTMRGDLGVRLKLTASAAYVVKIDGSGSGSQFVHGGEIKNFILDGGGFATDGLYLRNVVSANYYRVRATNVTNACLHLAWAQLTLFDSFTCSNNVEGFSTVPAIGILIDNANGGGSSSANIFINPTIEQLQLGAGAGIGIKAQWAINSVFTNGTSEGNKIAMVLGDPTSGTGIGNSIIGMDMESNVQADVVAYSSAYDNDFVGPKCTTNPTVTFTASVGGATSGTITPAYIPGVYTFTFSDAEVRTVTVAAGGTAATWSPALSAGTITTANTGASILTIGSGSNTFLGGFSGGLNFDSASAHNQVQSHKFFGANAALTDNGTLNAWNQIYNVSNAQTITEFLPRRRTNFVLGATGSVSIDLSTTSLAVVTFNGAGASTITVNNPTNLRDATDLDVVVHNAGAGALTLAWGASFKVPTLTLPTNGFNRTYHFRYDPNYGFLYFANQTASDVPN